MNKWLVRRWIGQTLKKGLKLAMAGAKQGIVLCRASSGVSMAANKVPGVRATLCGDAEAARGARLWDDANVLAMGLRSSSLAVTKEVLLAVS